MCTTLMTVPSSYLGFCRAWLSRTASFHLVAKKHTIRTAVRLRNAAQTGSKTAKQLAAIDQLLVAGVTQGPAKTKDAIKKILQLFPRWTRRECCQRIRQLRKTSELAGLAAGRPKGEKVRGKWVHSEERSAYDRALCLRWTPAHDEKLVKLAGYEPVKKLHWALTDRVYGRIARGAFPALTCLGAGGPPA